MTQLMLQFDTKNEYFQGLCVTNKLDSSRDDFETGHLDTYTGGVLGECNGFNAGAEVDGWEMIIFHSGMANIVRVVE